MCPQCGGLVVYADDSTVTITDTDAPRLSPKLTETYDAVARYFSANKLKVNDDKNHLLVMTTSKKRENGNLNVSINTPSAIIQASRSERLLGVDIHENMKFQEYILYGESLPLKSLNKRLNALTNPKDCFIQN